VHNFIKKWKTKLEKWDDIIEKIKFEEVLVGPPSDVSVESRKKTIKETLLLKGPEVQQVGESENPAILATEGGSSKRSSSSSEGGETETTNAEGEEVEHVDSDEQNDSDDDNEPVGVVESDYKPTNKQVADQNESQKRKALNHKSGEPHKKSESVAGSSQKLKAICTEVSALRHVSVNNLGINEYIGEVCICYEKSACS
jgi:uncharacterized phage infection (PIP) family protein YhgE